MRVLWDESPLSAREGTERLADEKEWHRNTVNTFLSRLKKKNAVITASRKGGVEYYSPQLDEATYTSAATHQFVAQLFDGRITPLVASFANEGQLTAEQIQELGQLLENLSENND